MPQTLDLMGSASVASQCMQRSNSYVHNVHHPHSYSSQHQYSSSGMHSVMSNLPSNVPNYYSPPDYLPPMNVPMMPAAHSMYQTNTGLYHQAPRMAVNGHLSPQHGTGSSPNSHPELFLT